MGLMEFIVDDRGLPVTPAGRISWWKVGSHVYSLSMPSTVSSPMERKDYEGIFFFADMNPPHAMRCWIMRKLDRFHLAEGAKVMDGSRLLLAIGVPGVPVSTDRYFDFAVTIDIVCSDADVVAELVTFFSLMEGMEQMLLPGWVFIPDKVPFVRKEDVLITVAINISDSETISDGDLRIDGLGLERSLGGKERTGPKPQKQRGREE